MSELKIQLTGWQAIIALVVFIGVIVIRLMTLSDMRDDKDLMKQIDTLLMDEYSPYVAEKMRDAVDKGEKDEIENAANSVTTTKVNIVSVQASYPIFKFSLPKDVVIKVVFSLDDATETGEKRTIYYLFKRGVLGWQYQYITSSLSYYLNFT
jgi:hypothetical protein